MRRTFCAAILLLSLTCLAGSAPVFFFNDTATTEIYTLSLHDALPIWTAFKCRRSPSTRTPRCPRLLDRKSTRLNSSHPSISYAVFCLKKKIRGQPSAIGKTVIGGVTVVAGLTSTL